MIPIFQRPDCFVAWVERSVTRDFNSKLHHPNHPHSNSKHKATISKTNNPITVVGNNFIFRTGIWVRCLVHPGLRSCLSSPRLRLLAFTSAIHPYSFAALLLMGSYNFHSHYQAIEKTDIYLSTELRPRSTQAGLTKR